eukprot:TRINITY_DN14849_c0_g2_i8.p1 TRINITY_DN14849_c0_g2~~TRINITY_DN14849_c0_g2_i8.p1  ORF type:complete len:651 (+),score=215.94 TRINITY_DN14849_c0_g2_i8:144-2096(+)
MKKKLTPNDDIQFTQEEFRRLKRAMENPEFYKHLEEYVNEVTDPAGRKEREEYMLEQEKRNDLPPNTRLVRPEAMLCMKTYTRRLLNSQGVRKYVDGKLFINVCTSPYMDPPASQDAIQNGQKVQSWSLPYTLSKPRLAKDNKGGTAMAIDIIFNTKCKASIHHEGFKKMLCDTAIDGVNTYLKEYTEKASQNYKVLQKMKYKGGVPELILLKKHREEGQSALSENLKAENHLPEVMREIYGEKEKTQAKTEEEPEAPDVDITAAEAIQQQKKAKKKRIKAYKEKPKYTITESHVSDLGECFEGPTSELLPKTVKKIPQTLVIRIELPGVRSTKNAKLELQEKRLKFEYLENYILDIPLPYYVNDGSARAKYNKDRETLTVEVDVDKSRSALKKEPEIVDLTDIKKENAKEEPLEVEEIVIPSLFNIYKSSEPPKPKDAKVKTEESKVEVKFREERSEDVPVSPQEPKENTKPLITEVEGNEVKREVKKEVNEEVVDYKNAPTIEGKYDFRQFGEFVVLTYKVQGYKKETATYKLTTNEMLLEVFDPMLKAKQRTCVTLFAPVVLSGSSIDFLVDFISIKLKKADSSKVWESLGYEISQLTEVEEPQEESPPPAAAEPQEEDEAEEVEQKVERVPTQYVHLKSPMIFSIY